MTKRVDETETHNQHYNEIRMVLEKEPFAEFMGMKLTEFGPGTASAQMVPTPEMLNSHSTVHGGVIFSLADYVFAVASNSYGKTSVGVTTTMNFMSAALPGEMITATATEDKRNHKLAWYTIEVRNDRELLASMQAMVYRKSEFFVPASE